LRSFVQQRTLTLATAALLAIVFAASGCGQGAGGPSGSSPPRNGEILFAHGPDFYLQRQLYLMRPDGRHQRPIMRAPDEVVNLSWSPDGEWIAYAIYLRESHCSQLYLVRADGTGAKRLGHNRCSGDPAWSPDGSRIAFSKSAGGFSGGGISTMKVDGSDLRQLTHGNRLPDFAPAWSPDGTTIAFVQDPQVPSLWLMDADGTNQHRLRTPSRYAYCEGSSEPDWSPDGHWIAFTRICGAYDPSLRTWSNIFVVRPDGTGLRPLTDAGLRRKFSNDSPAWSPDGKRIVFVSDRGAKASLSDIYVMNADGTRQKRLTRLPGWSGFPAWGARR
jgi:Tol biopolymer transport system component